MKLTLNDFLGESGVKIYENYIAMLCPFHPDRTPSLLVRDTGFKCMACGAKGSLRQLKNKLEGVTARPAVRSGRATPNIPEDLETFAFKAHDHLVSDTSLQYYLRDRGVANMLVSAKLGYFEGWYTVPVFNKEYNVVGVTLRAGPSMQKRTGLRFTNPLGQNAMMYVPDWTLWNGADELYIVFGIFTALAMAAQGWPVATTVGGKHTFNPMWLASERKKIKVIPDVGELKDASNLVMGLGWRGEVWLPHYPDGCEDMADIAARGLKIGDYL
jgi:hypothetical protein